MVDLNAGLDVDGHTELDDVNVSTALTANNLVVTGSTLLKHSDSLKLQTIGIGVSISNGIGLTATIAGPSNLIIDPGVVGDNTGTVRIKGDLFVDGTQTQINSTTIELADFIVGVATTATSDSLADGAGIQIGPNNTFLYEHNSGTNPSLKSSENLNVASGKVYQVDQTEVLSATTLGSGVVNSSLTNLGTLTALTVSGAIDANGNLDVDGHTELDNVNISGIATFASNVDINADLDVDGRTELDITNISETLNVTGIATFANNIDANGDLDVDGHTELDNVNVSAASTFGGLVDINAGGQANTFKVEDLTDNRVVIAGTGGELEDSGNFTFNGSLLNVTGQIDATNIVVGSATTITSSGIVAGIVTGTLDNTLTLATSGTGLSGSATYNNSGAQTFTVTSNATNANTASTLVARDGSGDFSAGTITATLTGNVTGNLTGTATTATNLANGANITTGTISDDRLPDLITSNVNIASGISSVATLDATNATIDNLTFTSGTAITSIDTDLSSVSSSDDTLASAKAIKTYIDTEVTAQDLDFQADTGGALSIDLDSETLSVVGTSNEIETAGSGNQIQIGLPNEVAITTSLVVGSATTINAAGIIAGVITATTFSGGLETSNLSGTITNAQLAGSIANSKLANSSVSFGGVSVALGAADATPAFDLSDATNYPTSSLTGTITNAQLAGSIANGKLANSSIAIGGITFNLGDTDATPAFDLQDATGYPTSSLTGTITNAQLAGSIADGKLASTFLKNVVEDTSPQLGGTLDTNGNLIQFGDSGSATDDRLQFGASQDLQIYHDATDSIIDNTNGDLYLKTTGSGDDIIIRAADDVIIQTQGSEGAVIARGNGTVELYYDGSKKFETTGIGVSIVNGTETTATIAGPANLVLDPAAVGDNTGAVRIKGDLFVDGTTTQINSTTLELADFVVGVATTATTDLLTDGAGIGIGSDKTFLYEHNGGTNPSLKSSENLNVASGKGYQINQTEVLNATTLGSNVVSSSLTSVGTLSALTVGGDVSIADKIVHTGDTNTAIRFPAADTITAETGGTERLRVTSAGDVGINTTGPNAKLTVGPVDSPTFNRGAVAIKAVQDDNSLPTNIYLEEASGAEGYQLSIDSNGDLNFHNSGAAAPTVTFSDDNKVGILTSTPTHLLHISKNTSGEVAGIKISGNDGSGDGGSAINLADNETVKWSIFTRRYSSNNRLYISTAENDSSSSKVTITEGGNVGINETSPNTQLVVKGASNGLTNSVGNINVISSDSAAINLGGSIGLGGFYNGTSNSIPFANLHGKKENGTNNNADGYFAISTRNSSAGTVERMRISSTGVITMGTGTNTQIFADGEAQFAANKINFASNGVATMRSTTFKHGSPSTGTCKFTINPENNSQVTLAYDDEGSVVFGTSSDPATQADFSDKLLITSAGDMRLGTGTPTSFGPTFQIAGTDPCLLLQDTATAVDYYGMNIGNGHVTNWFDDSAYFAIGTAAGISGASYSEKLRISSDGKIGIGTTGTSALLTIKGDSNEVTVPSIRLLDGTDTREVSITNTAGDFVASTHGTDDATHGRIKIFESGVFSFDNGGASGTIGTRLKILADGKILAGHTASRDVFKETRVQISGANGDDAGLSIFSTEDGASGPNLILGHSRNGAAVDDGDILGDITFVGHDSTDLNSRASIIRSIMTADGTNNSLYADLVFFTKRNSGGYPEESLRITSAGKVGINISDNTTADLLVRSGTNGAGILRVGGNNSGAIGLDITYSNSSYTSTIFKQNYRSTNAGALMEFDSGYFVFKTGTSGTERLHIQSNGQLLFKGTSGDNQFTSRRTNAAGSNGDYFFHLNAQNSDSTTVGSLGFHRDTATDDSRFVILTRNTGGSNTERLRIDSSGNLQRPKSLSQEVSTSVSSVSATSCGSFAKATYRSAYVIAQITQGSSYQVGRYLVIHDGTTATTVEESAIATGDMLGTFEGVISGSNVEFRVTMGSASSATVITKIESIVV